MNPSGASLGSSRGRIPDPGYSTIPDMLRSLVERFGERECIVLGKRRLSYAQIEAESARLARGLLASGVGKGTRVALLAPNGPDFAIGMLAAGRIGALLVPVNTFYQADEIAWTLRHADVHTLLTVPRLLSHDYVARLEEALPGLHRARGPRLHLADFPYLREIRVLGDCDRVWALREPAASEEALSAAPEIDAAFLRAVEDQVSPSDWNVIIYTSGSTAQPKGIVQSQGSLVRHSWFLGSATGLCAEDRFYTPNAFFFIGGYVFSLLAPLQQGVCLLCEERFEPGETLAYIERERATVVSGWAHYGPAMADHASFASRDLSSVRAGYLREILPTGAVELPITLGMSEMCASHTFWPPGPPKPPGSLGTAAPGVEHKIVEPGSDEPLPAGTRGELCVRGHTLMQGMYKREREEVFAADGWYHTGDAATLDADGHLYFHGRLGDVIKTGGANVSPQEVEAVLMAQPEVMEAHVVGLPDPERGQRVAAAVVLVDGASLDPETLRERLRTRLAAYKVPRRFDFCAKSELPYRATGKIDKRALIERMSAR
jgi:acyl-CoA synthetase (AMP-forming)/AMP-acid ligase II